MRCNEMCGMQLWPRYLEPREWVGLVERWQVWLWCSCSDRGRSGGWRAGGPNPQTAVAKQSVHSTLHSLHIKYRLLHKLYNAGGPNPQTAVALHAKQSVHCRHCTHCTQSTSCTMLVDSTLIPQTALCSFWQCTQSTVYSAYDTG